MGEFCNFPNFRDFPFWGVSLGLSRETRLPSLSKSGFTGFRGLVPFPNIVLGKLTNGRFGNVWGKGGVPKFAVSTVP